MMGNVRMVWRERFAPLDRFLFVASAVAAVLFVALRPFTPYPGDYFLKVLPIVYLALLCLKYVTGAHGVWLCLALTFSAGGDLVLEHNPGGWFVFGLGLFLVAHVCYILLFKKEFAFRLPWLPAAALTALFGAGMATYLIPHLGRMLLPVLGYILVISGMGVFAAFRTGANVPVFLGALTFLSSDTFIALNRFVGPDPVTPLLVMPTYYVAQFLIAGGYLFDPNYLAPPPEPPRNYRA